VIKAVIFDMDGLMFDTERLAKDGWQKSSEILGFKITDDILKEVMGLDTENTKKVFCKSLGDDFDFNRAREVRVKYAIEHIEYYGVPIKKGLFELLNFLIKNDIKRAVATSTKKENALYLLKKAKVLDLFDEIVCGDMVEHGKPEPDIFLKAAELLGVQPDECLVLEDSPHGILAAYRGGFMPVMVPDFIKPDRETEKVLFAKCASLIQVIDLIEKID